MTKAVSNITSTEIVLGGVVIKPSCQETIREVLITQDEVRAIQEHAVMRFEHMVITVSEEENGLNNSSVNAPVECWAYPQECITKEGLLSQSKKVQTMIAKLQEDNKVILDDKSFIEMYPSVNIEDFRLTPIIEEVLNG